MQTITRKGTFDSMHRVMNERFKCHNVHGHTYLYELAFKCTSTLEIGYTVDFKEIKRVAQQFIDDYFDHGAILNPKDQVMINSCFELGSKVWLMSLNGKDYCNPTVENIAKEVFLCVRQPMHGVKGLQLHMVRIYETPNCFTDVYLQAINSLEVDLFYRERAPLLNKYRDEKGTIEYDDRKKTDATS